MTFSPSTVFRWLWSPVAGLWREIIGLRTEEIRSLAVVTGIVLMAVAFDRIRHGDGLASAFVVIAILGQLMVFGLAWQATSIKGQWGEAMLHIGRDPDPEKRITYSATDPGQEARQFAVDDPDEIY